MDLLAQIDLIASMDSGAWWVTIAGGWVVVALLVAPIVGRAIRFGHRPPPEREDEHDQH